MDGFIANAPHEGLEQLAQRALGGDRSALQALVLAIQGDVHGLALRMLGNPTDAEDASQEILIKIITHLASFRGESAFGTWVWRVACNHLLAARKGQSNREPVWLEEVVARTPSQTVSPEHELLAAEVMHCCVQAMQLALDRDQRMAFILREVLGLSSDEGAAILGVRPATLRKRVSRASAALRRFLLRRCGVVDERNPCRCAAHTHSEPPPATEPESKLAELLRVAVSPQGQDAPPSARDEMRQMIGAAPRVRIRAELPRPTTIDSGRLHRFDA